MADDVVSEVLDAVGDVAGAVGGELKKFGQAVATQGTGRLQKNTSGSQSSPSTSTLGVKMSDVSPAGEFKKILQTAGSQITGHAPTFEADQIAKMAKKDEEFSNTEAAAVRARISQIYQEYAAKRAKEQKQKQLEEQQKEQEKAQVAQIGEKKKQEEMDVAVAQAKAKAEVKNYGAE